MPGCMFCGRTADIGLWVLEDVVEEPVLACRACGQERGLIVVRSEVDDGDLPEHESCQCCGRQLPTPGGWPVTVWVLDRRRLMAVCNACRVEYALEAVFVSAPPTGEPAPREPEPPRGEPGMSPPD